MPNTPSITPAMIERPAKLTSVVIENSTRPKYSGGPKCSARSATFGPRKAMASVPSMPAR